MSEHYNLNVQNKKRVYTLSVCLCVCVCLSMCVCVCVCAYTDREIDRNEYVFQTEFIYDVKQTTDPYIDILLF